VNSGGQAGGAFGQKAPSGEQQAPFPLDVSSAGRRAAARVRAATFPEEHDACGVGFIADLGGPASHELVRLALQAVGAMAHRGARAADGRTGDGAGLLCETPRKLLARELAAVDLRAPANHIAAICVFLPREPDAAAAVRAAVEAAAHAQDVRPLRWRVPPTDEDVLGRHARTSRPAFEQLIVDTGPGNSRERMRSAARNLERSLREFPLASLSSASTESVVYKALISSDELAAYFGDLRDELFASRFAVFHQRFSTNSSPSWRLVQPFRHIGHNGEFNTLTGNRAWLEARGIRATPGASDSYEFNVGVGAMIGAGYRIDEAIDLMLAPSIEPADERLRAYYDAHLPTVEPWDGPAAIVYADGDVVGAALDRTGLRPLRWCRTASNKVLCASEAGVVDFGNDPIVKRGRLGPGGRLVVRFASRELIETAQFRDERRAEADFRAVVASWSFDLQDGVGGEPPGELLADLTRFACTREELKDIVAVLAAGAEPTYSMGDDAALAMFTGMVPVADYFRQRFAQVTNPAIDQLRESFVFDTRALVGAGDINGDVPAADAAVVLESAILSEYDFDRLRFDERMRQAVIPLALDRTLESRLRAICDEAERAVAGGASLIVLDDRPRDPSVPALLAAGAVHQRLVSRGLRMQASIAVADGSARDAHAVAALIGAGANVVTPWLGLRAAHVHGSRTAYLGALRAGLLKILAKLGVCTLRSYIGAQTFESIGLAREVGALCFPGVRAHAPALGFADLEADVRAWFEASRRPIKELPDRGTFRYRRDGIRHAFDPAVIKNLRAAALTGDGEAFDRLSGIIAQREPVALRDVLAPVALRDAIDPDGVESAASIVSRFATAAMSLGALSPEAHETIALGANLAGARSNSGEGGEGSSRFVRSEFPNARSRIKQVASARFGVGPTYLASADEIEIKIAQGSKPGEGGQIPGHKVTPEIAALRGAIAGQALVSPPPHHDIYSIEDLAQLIYDLRRAAPQARIAVKLVSQSGIGYVASGVAKADADVIHISGHDGGTGASPLGSIKHAGLPWEIGLVETHHALIANGLRSRVRLRVDGGLKNGHDVILASMLGADEFGFGSALLVALGCIYARQCHKNTCPVGIATQDLALRAKFNGTAREAARFLEFIADDVRRRLAALGARSLDEVHGRSDLLRRRAFEGDRYAHIDLSEILRLPERAPGERRPAVSPTHLDDLVSRAAGVPQAHPLTIAPADRAVGARLAHEWVVRRAAGEAPGEIAVHYAGTAGQSFGAFLTAGIILDLDGDANDYVGKSMEGGRVVIRGFGDAGEPVAGNACFYGARGGEGFLRGSAGERFAVRNSGASLVCEGTGDHGCEYMTAGTVAVLGPAGKNFASGMSGGAAFVVAADAPELGSTALECRPCPPGDPDGELLRDLIARHAQATGSARAAAFLRDWPRGLAAAWKVTAPVAGAAESPPERRPPAAVS
jgi:glutamate synthase domain-containing protein 2/glutamate synthase domain-containing protein 1/glutamate synthase domain-containing protein 3